MVDRARAAQDALDAMGVGTHHVEQRGSVRYCAKCGVRWPCLASHEAALRRAREREA